MEYYSILGLGINSNAKQIVTAYRKLALKLHPDKNPTQEAVNLFQQVQEAYNVLSDDKARAAYDEVFRLKERNQRRFKEMDAKRQLMRESLIERELAAKKMRYEETKVKAKFEAEMERLKKKSSTKLKEDIWTAEYNESKDSQVESESKRTCILKWDSQPLDESEIRSNFKNIDRIIHSQKSILIVFESSSDAILASTFVVPGLTISLLSNQDKTQPKAYSTFKFDSNFEERVLNKLRSAQAKKEFIDQPL